MHEWFGASFGVVLCLLTTILIGCGMEAGAAFARWRHGNSPSDSDRFLATLAAPSLGLLALLIGFTFSMALSRFDARRSALLTEANAIGTAALRGRMLPEPFRSTVAPLFKEYALLRIANTADAVRASAVMGAVRQSLSIQESLWRAGMDAARADPQMVPSGLFIQALNDMIDVHTERLTAARNTVPTVVFVMLDGVAFVAFGFAGYGLQLASTRLRGGMWVMALMMGSAITLVVDLDRPRMGFITVDQQPLLDLVDGLK